MPESATIHHTRPVWPALGALLCLGGAAAVGAGLLPQLIGSVIDAAIGGSVAVDQVLWYGVAAVAVQLVRWGYAVLQTDLAWRAQNGVRAALVAHVLQLAPAFFRSHGVGELTERIEDDVAAATAALSGSIPQLVSALVLVLVVCIGLARTDVTTAALMLAYVVSGSVVVHLTQRERAEAWEAERAADAALSDALEETMYAADDIRAVDAAADRAAALLPRYADRMHSHRDASFGQQWGSVAASAVVALGWVLAAGLGIWQYGTGVGSIGTAFAVLASVRLFVAPMETFGNEWSAIQRATGAITRCDALFAVTPVAHTGGAALPSGALELSLAGVAFRYPAADAPAVTALDLDIPAGQHVALIGRTGSGKTTLGRLMARLETPDAGEIVLGGVPLNQIAEATLRRRVGVISQTDDALPGTLGERMAGFRTDCSDTDIHAALATLGLTQWLAQFPAGLATPIGAPGRILTPGEAQLVAAVRLFLQQPGLVILDEATAHVDPATETLLRTALAQVTAARTTITIAHRLTTIAAADVVVVLVAGAIVEAGPPAVLAADPRSAYAQLLAHDREVLP